MFKSSQFLTCFTKDEFIVTADDAIKAFSNLPEYDSEKEYTVIFDNENNTLDIYQLI